MTVKKLSEFDKQEIIKLYRQTGETTSTLAERYGVSNSTISRLLKSTLAEDEYEALIDTKRAARTLPKAPTSGLPLLAQLEPNIVAQAPLEAETPLDNTAVPKLRRRSSTTPKLKSESPAQLDVPSPPTATAFSQQDNKVEALEIRAPIVSNQARFFTDEEAEAEASTVAQMLGEELLDESEELTDLEDEDLEDLDEDALGEYTPVVRRRISAGTLVEVLPLSEANLPRTCYLVIDRASELITRPLRDFGDLGQIPIQEFQQKTLPVFDNHRIARRFSTKRDRVIKVPDSRMLQKTRSHLEAKGITRLLVDGQIYSLLPT